MSKLQKVVLYATAGVLAFVLLLAVLFLYAAYGIEYT
jgi:hypothetical protein